MASPLFIFSQSPYESDRAREGIEALLACAAFDQEPDVLFIDQAVLLLVPTEELSGTKNLNKMVKAFEIYGVQTIYADLESLERFGLTMEQITPLPTILTAERYAGLINKASWILRF
jgi:tRNA 2-thiouridine synthesizing protein C